MEGKEAIINKIITDSEKLGKSYIEEAQEKADYEINIGKTYAGDYEKKKKAEICKEFEAIIKRKESAADIEVNKMLLKKKQEIIDDVIKFVLDNIKTDKKSYKKLLINAVEEYAENNDTVLISKQDKDIISKQDIDLVATSKKIKLSFDLSEEIKSGVVLSSDYYDKNFTISALLKQVKEKYITEINKILFSTQDNK